MNSKLDLKIKSAVSKKKRSIYFLTALLSATLTTVVFFFKFSSNETTSWQEDKSDTSLSLDSVKNKKIAKIKSTTNRNEEFLYNTEIKPILISIAGKDENKNIYSNRARELLVLLNELDKTPWRDKKRANFLVERVETFIEQINRLKNEYINNLNTAFLNRDIPAFESNLKSLKGISYGKAFNNEWDKTLTKLKKIEKVSLRASAARASNSLKNELEALKNLEKLTVLDYEEKDRLRSLKANFRELKYSEHIKESKNFLTLRQYSSAKEELSSALAIFAKRKDAIALQEQIEFEWKSANFNKAVQAANQLIQNDNWFDAEKKLKTANLLFPTDDEIREKLKLSQKINRLIDKLQFLLNQPMRLTDSNIREYALKLADDNAAVFSKSSEAIKLKNALLKLLQKLKEPREISLISDGRAKIEIKKVGYVEPTNNKTILLYPGSYQFVAKCRGHKDNLKKVKIPFDEEKIIVRIGCGEQI